MPGARWFPNARLNYAENLLRYRDDADALVFWGEDKLKRRLSHRALYEQASQFARALHAQGVRTGDRVAGYLPNLPETIVLNPGGVRIGTAEIHRQVEKLPEVLEAVVIGQDWPPEQTGDVRVVLFVKLRPEIALDNQLIENIKRQIRQNTTPRHVPAKALQVDDIPRTKSGKIVELAVRNAVHGRPVTNVESLANPEALDHFRNRPELAT